LPNIQLLNHVEAMLADVRRKILIRGVCTRVESVHFWTQWSIFPHRCRSSPVRDVLGAVAYVARIGHPEVDGVREGGRVRA
jgi:hypothetical protein